MPQHDFAAIRKELGITAELPLLEAMAHMSPERARWSMERLCAWEDELADHAEPAPGVHALISSLEGQGARLGVLTRNRRSVALRALGAIGLRGRFEHVLGREDAPHKPSPAGILWQLSRWSALPQEAAMVGDNRLDILAGQRAGVFTALIGPPQSAIGLQQAPDTHVPDLPSLLAQILG